MLCTIARVTLVVCVTEQLCRTRNTNGEYASVVQTGSSEEFVYAMKQQQHGSTDQQEWLLLQLLFFKFLGVCVRTIAGVALVVCVTEQLCHKRITDL